MNELKLIKSKTDLEDLVKDKNALARLKDDKVEEFKTNFIELWNNKYLIQNADAAELLNFCIQITNIGLSVNPWHNEIYILPFSQKGQQGKKLEAVYRKEAIEELAFNCGFQIEADTIWNIGGEGILYGQISYLDQSKLKTNDVKFITTNFIGFEVRFYDLKGNLRPQKFTITYEYLKHISSGIEKDSEQIAKLLHKAYRKAFKLAFIPKGRDTRDVLSKLDNLNYKEDEIIDAKVTETSTIDIKKALSVEDEIINYSVNDIGKFYNLDKSKWSLMGVIFTNNKGWKTDYNQEQLNNLMIELKKV